ncbi:MAG: cation diffusion facilitator family transporter [Saprospiraceae bacterium]|nr:cation diffusion facilitator family transporter [Saprospiraceae bacterium]
MAHDHSHHLGHHDHSISLQNVNAAFIIGISLNIVFVLIEVTVGLQINSLSLISDAGHNLADVGSLALSLLAFRLMKLKSTEQYTYGFRKTSILVALFNSVLLLLSIGAIIYEAAHRFFNPEVVAGTKIAIVAAGGVLINGITAFLFLKDKDKDLNIKSAYWHLLSDTLVSLGIVIGGLVIYFTKWYWIDSALSILVAIIILFSTWSLLKDSLKLSIDGVPEGISLTEVKNTAMSIVGVSDFHHIHVWAISTTENALTAHMVLPKDVSISEEMVIKKRLKHELEHLQIHHITIETERSDNPCVEKDC